jgi:hypothetical protein
MTGRSIVWGEHDEDGKEKDKNDTVCEENLTNQARGSCEATFSPECLGKS